jgi:hypothetical protein
MVRTRYQLLREGEDKELMVGVFNYMVTVLVSMFKLINIIKDGTAVFFIQKQRKLKLRRRQVL